MQFAGQMGPDNVLVFSEKKDLIEFARGLARLPPPYKARFQDSKAKSKSVLRREFVGKPNSDRFLFVDEAPPNVLPGAGADCYDLRSGSTLVPSAWLATNPFMRLQQMPG